MIYNGNTITASCSDASIAAYKIVMGDVDETTNTLLVVEVATADTHYPLGVTVTKTTADDQLVTIQTDGVAMVQVDGAAAAIDVGTQLVAGTAGVAHAISSVDEVAQEVLGIALAPSAADGDIIPVLIDRTSLVEGA